MTTSALHQQFDPIFQPSETQIIMPAGATSAQNQQSAPIFQPLPSQINMPARATSDQNQQSESARFRDPILPPFKTEMPLDFSEFFAQWMINPQAVQNECMRLVQYNALLDKNYQHKGLKLKFPILLEFHIKDLMDFSFNEGNKLLSLVCNEETLLDKKRRWLQISTFSSTNGYRFPRKRPKFLSQKFVPESLVRSDEVSCENVKASVEKSFGYFSNSKFKHHLVEDHFDPSKIHINKNHKNALSYIPNDLTNNALYKIAQIVSSNDSLKFEKTRSNSLNIIKSHFVSFLSNPNRNSQHFNKISEIFKDPCSYLENNLKLVTPFTKELQISIEKTLEGLDEMKFQELVAIYRKLRGLIVENPPECPPVFRSTYNTENLLKRVKAKCDQFLHDLEIGEELPIEFAKGLAVIILSLNYHSGCTNVLAYEFFPFSEEILRAQNEILKALKLVDKVKPDKLKPLRPILDPNDKIPRTTFRIALRKYLIEWLFICDEINLPKEGIQAIELINGVSKMQLDFFSKDTRDKEAEMVLNVSCFLKSSVLNVTNAQKEDENLEDDKFNSNEFFENKDFESCGNNYFFNLGNQELGQEHGSVSNYASNSCNNTNYDNNAYVDDDDDDDDGGGGDDDDDDDDNNNNNNNNNLMGDRNEIGRIGSEIGSEIELNEICDETALVAHKLVGNLLDGFLQFEKRKVDESTRFYLLDGLQNHGHFKGGKGKSKISQEKMKADILVTSIENVLPNFPKSFVDKADRLMGL